MQRSQIATSFLPAPGSAASRMAGRARPDRLRAMRSPSWRRAPTRSARAARRELVWLVEHPPLYTAGTSARIEDLVEPDRFPVFDGRPRRRIHLSRAGPARGLCDARPEAPARGRARLRGRAGGMDHRRAGALQRQGRAARGPRRRLGRRPDRPPLPDGSPAEDKIAAIGIRLRRWVSFHGIAINVEPDLSHFSGIVPCGVADHGVTSLVDLGLPVTMADLDIALKAAFDGGVRAGAEMPEHDEPERRRDMDGELSRALACGVRACSCRACRARRRAAGGRHGRAGSRRAAIETEAGRPCRAADGRRRQSASRPRPGSKCCAPAATRPMRWSRCRPCSAWSSRNPPASAAARSSSGTTPRPAR